MIRRLRTLTLWTGTLLSLLIAAAFVASAGGGSATGKAALARFDTALASFFDVPAIGI